jgi:ATPase subunit of ABC transporter with duplicated ATPase domains
MNEVWDAWPWMGAALLSIVITSAFCRWRHSREMGALRKRLLQSEQLRQAEQERARQARTQIAQLTQWVSDLQKRLPQEASAQARRARVERLVPDQPAVHSAPALPAHGFADTMPLARAPDVRT